MEKWDKLMEKRWAANLFVVFSGIVFFSLVWNLKAVMGGLHWVMQILSPLVCGLVIAYLLDPVVKFFEEKVFGKMKDASRRRILSVVAGIVLVALLFALFLLILVPSLAESFAGIIANADVYETRILEFMAMLDGLDLGFELNLDTLAEYVEKYAEEGIELLRSNAGSIINASKNIGSAVFNLGIGFIFGVYFLAGKKGMLGGLAELRGAAVRPDTLAKQNSFLARCHDILIQYIGCTLLDAVIVGVVNALVMTALRMPYTALVSVVCGVTNILPTFGPMIGGIVGAFILVLNNPIYAVWFLILTMILQTLDGYVIKPRLFGDSLGIPPVLTLAAIIIGGKLFGIGGILLSIPAAAVLMYLYTDQFLPWLKRRNS
ncbi:MAG: AI-2E family transporter [Lachnospiraceae bacterium]|nr:AI-2E family transporter [Lachnospiraceae bacterium]